MFDEGFGTVFGFPRKQEFVVEGRFLQQNLPFGERILDLKELNDVLGANRFLEHGAAYAAASYQEYDDCF